MRYLGAHVSAAGGLENSLIAAKELEIGTIQIHPSPPQKWNTKEYPKGFETKYLESLLDSKVEKTFFHGIYLINLATPADDKRKLAELSLRNYLDLQERIGGSGVVFHLGSLKDEPDEKLGLSRISEAINRILEKQKGKSRLILEVAAGSGRVIGSKLMDLRKVYDSVEDKSRVGYGLDTQHLWASGYDIKDSYDYVMKEIDETLGLDKVWSIHLNDSKSALGSRVDRHENLGEGVIGYDALQRMVQDPRLRDIPFILETPGLKTLEGAATEVAKLKEMAKN